jgi:hypothetical protein
MASAVTSASLRFSSRMFLIDLDILWRRFTQLAVLQGGSGDGVLPIHHAGKMTTMRVGVLTS